MTNDLKPCPFCGGTVEITQKSIGYIRGGTFTAEFSAGCGQCDIGFVRESKFKVVGGKTEYIYNGYEEVKNLWNRRASEEGD